MSPAPWAAHFGLSRTPFGKAIPARDLFGRPAHAEAIARISFCVVEQALGVVTGDVGAGKTVALRAAVAALDPTRHQVIYIANPAFGARGFYVTIVRALGDRPRYLKAELMAQASDLLAAEAAERHRRVVIIIDEAHLLDPAQLEELRLLTNAEMDSASPFAAILAGQPTLNRQLRLGMFAALDQRIATRFTIKPMDLPESAAYLKHHLALAGREEPLFADDATTRLHRVANGLPRALNNAAVAALNRRGGSRQGPGRRCLRQESSRRAHPRLAAAPAARPPCTRPWPPGSASSPPKPNTAAPSPTSAPATQPTSRPASTPCCSKQSPRSPACSTPPAADNTVADFRALTKPSAIVTKTCRFMTTECCRLMCKQHGR